ncbi:hypothetical protein EVAR_85838_1 [Eumeta japonica]|uniref:Uncharacterized protein n=1 Tax=Eumeta variegata TaxID=151549 RepID=A0A4C1UQN6_EUMVA|nr:hypothetical protein EVAR_85838_1 [Eumeta japonica]
MKESEQINNSAGTSAAEVTEAMQVDENISRYSSLGKSSMACWHTFTASSELVNHISLNLSSVFGNEAGKVTKAHGPYYTADTSLVLYLMPPEIHSLP